MMNDDQLISLAIQARKAAHTAGRSIDSARIAFSASRHFETLLMEVDRRKLDRAKIFGVKDEKISVS